MDSVYSGTEGIRPGGGRGPAAAVVVDPAEAVFPFRKVSKAGILTSSFMCRMFGLFTHQLIPESTVAGYRVA
ncbi:hypothetical protein N7539_000112 [Penicillium diatomitis]|uniref:Uncharacterized protein n=1 Tax=Penicillium diatomitis TaxID=2819901 RepID=A0A9X0C207_9EURO|nr:uncharacterized protein N7539_000112 [Penicillium diatomitis]KAJ5494996.1 hypothetical protein N7539_000112 [Penicillium diatomitis]